MYMTIKMLRDLTVDTIRDGYYKKDDRSLKNGQIIEVVNLVKMGHKADMTISTGTVLLDIPSRMYVVLTN